jgi:hypothetical protein
MTTVVPYINNIVAAIVCTESANLLIFFYMTKCPRLRMKFRRQAAVFRCRRWVNSHKKM